MKINVLNETDSGIDLMYVMFNGKLYFHQFLGRFTFLMTVYYELTVLIVFL